MHTSARILASGGVLIGLLPWLMSCGGDGNESVLSPPPANAPPPANVASVGIFAQEKVLRNDRSLLASMPSRPGVTYSWAVVDGSASATLLEGATSNVIRFASGGNVGTFALRATTTSADGTAIISSRTLQVVQDWLLDSTNPLPRQQHSATLLDDGRVLVAGGVMGFGSSAPKPSAQIYDPETNTWGYARPIPTPRSNYSSTRLANGNVLVAGGMVGGGTLTVSGAAEIYDAASGDWRAAAAMLTARYGHTSTLLLDGRVLVTGGSNAAAVGGGPLASAEIYDPVADRWSPAGDLIRPREGHTAVRLRSGKVLVCAGIDHTNHLDLALSSSELYDPGTNSWSRTGDLAIARSFHTAELLPDGRVIVAGGAPVEAEAYDPATGEWSSAGSLTAPKMSHALSLLPDGRLLVTGGLRASEVQPTAEVYDPATNTWHRIEDMAEGRAYHTSTSLNNGMVLVVGGIGDSAIFAPLATAERYSPTSGKWSSAGRGIMMLASGHTSTVLSDGLLLQAGGEAGVHLTQGLRQSTLYDPTANSWQGVGDMVNARFGHTATLLANGEVLVAGGSTSNLATEPYLQTAEVYDPATRRWNAATSMGLRRGGHTATSLSDGRVLIVGGGEDPYHTASSAELYDRTANSWVPAGSMAEARHGHTATLLLDDRILVVGGASSDVLASAELFNVVSNAWQGAAPMSTRRWGHTATRLPNGKVLVVGGYGADHIPVAAAEVYDAGTDTWTATSAMSARRVFHTATLLPNGTVMVTGGLDLNFSQPPLASTEIYDPVTGTWSAQSPLNFARVRHSATLLVDGRVVVLGGGGPGAVEFWR